MEKIKYTIEEVLEKELLKKTIPGKIILGLNYDGKTYSFYSPEEIFNK